MLLLEESKKAEGKRKEKEEGDTVLAADYGRRAPVNPSGPLAHRKGHGPDSTLHGHYK